MNKAPCQRSHGLRFEPGTAANRAVFKAQGHADWTKISCMLVEIMVDNFLNCVYVKISHI